VRKFVYLVYYFDSLIAAFSTYEKAEHYIRCETGMTICERNCCYVEMLEIDAA